MITNCPECDLQVSDKAVSCPHCGYPLQPTKIRKYNPTKRKRLPNGFGQITEIKSKKLCKPFRAMVTVGKTELGKPICKLLAPEAYFETYNDAYAALLAYNRSPIDLSKNITIQELYERWSEQHYKKCRNPMTMKGAWKYCKPLYNKTVQSVRSGDIRKCIIEADTTATMKSVMKNIFNMMYDYAMEWDIIDRNYARSIKLGNIIDKDTITRHPHMTYSDEEMKVLWENAGKSLFVDLILVQCYSGWRPYELCTLRTEDVNIIDMTFKGGMKTKAGKDRVVPIHPAIQLLVERYYHNAKNLNSETLFCYVIKNGTLAPVNYPNFQYHYKLLKKRLGLDSNHKLHDGRKHFITLAKKYNVDEYAIKYMVGHTIADLTENVYTERSLSWLKSEMKKIRKEC